MSWLSDVFSGSDGDERERATLSPVERAKQLREGVASTAHAVGDEHGELARGASEAARHLEEAIRAAAEGTGGATPSPRTDRAPLAGALERLDRLHFALLEVVVKGEEPESVGLAAAIEAAEELAGRLEGPAAGPEGD